MTSPVFVVGDRVVVPSGETGTVIANDRVREDGTRRYCVRRWVEWGPSRVDVGIRVTWFDEDELVGAA